LSDHRIVVVTDGPVRVPSLPVNDQVSVVSLPVPVRSRGALRNIGMSLAASAYVAFLDDDNTWSKDHLSTCLDALRSTGADVAYAACTRALPGGEVVDTIGRPWDRRAFRHENWIDVSALVLARRVRYRWSRLPVGDDGTFAEDWSLVYFAGFRREVVFTGKATVQYTMSPELATLVRGQRGTISTGDDQPLS
jgi:glycosyltransferase involved in cell wall biosynthesis